jgi:hypothetical protein
MVSVAWAVLHGDSTCRRTDLDLSQNQLGAGWCAAASLVACARSTSSNGHGRLGAELVRSVLRQMCQRRAHCQCGADASGGGASAVLWQICQVGGASPGGPRVLVDMEDSLSGPSRLRHASSSSPWLLYRQGSARLGPSAPSGTGRPCHSGSESCQWPQVAVDWPGASSESPRPHPSLHRDWARLDYRALHLHRDLACLCDSDIRTVTV